MVFYLKKKTCLKLLFLKNCDQFELILTKKNEMSIFKFFVDIDQNCNAYNLIACILFQNND